MALLEVNKVKKEFGDILLFDDVTFSIDRNDRVALIGNNGCGKTTLIKMILGQLDYDDGSIHIANSANVGYLSQGVIQNPENTLYEELLHCFDDIINLQQKINSIHEQLENNPNDEKLLNEYGRLENLLLSKDGYNYEYQIDLMIHKFGFDKDAYNRKITSFSGGERSKIAFAKLLLNKPNLLILDEPTNHLDVSTIEWLEDYLTSYEGAILLVSHDRFFIDCVCNRIIEIDQKKASYYSGNYTYYLQEKVVRYENQLKAYNLQQKEIKHLEELIKKFKPKPTKVSFAKDREKKLARMVKIDKPKIEHKKVKFNIKEDNENRPVKQFSLIDVKVGYFADRPLASNLNDLIMSGDKIAIMGPNGCGKSTLLKGLTNLVPFLEGKLLKYRELKIGYYDQNQLEISGSENVFDYFHEAFPMFDRYQIRSQLGQFLFGDDDMEKSVDSLSGGEKARLSFAKLLVKKYDILLLDEPTNHLDMETKRVLEDALSSYNGTIIFVSHDRYFVDEIATRTYQFENNNILVHQGNYSQYRIDKIESIPLANSPIQEEKKKDSKKQKKKNNGMTPLKVEKLLTQKQIELDELNTLYSSEDICNDYVKLNEIQERINVLSLEIAELEELYLEFLE